MAKTKDLSFDLDGNKKFGKKSVSVVADDAIKLTFTNDISGQVVYAKSGNNVVVTAYGTKKDGESTVLDTTKVLGTVTYKNAAKHAADATIALDSYGHTGESALALLSQTYELKAAKKVTGSTLNETVTGTKANETFNLVTGIDTVNFKVETSTGESPVVTGFGHDTVKINDGESLELKATGLVVSGDNKDTIVAKRSGNNIVVSATRGTETKTDLGQVTIQGYNVGSSIDFEGFGADVSAAKLSELATTAEDATHKGNKFTGTVFADKAESTAKNETFALGKGNDAIAFKGVDSSKTEEYGKLIAFGKDNVALKSGETLTLDFGALSGSELSYKKNGNNAVVTASHTEADTKKVYSYEKTVVKYESKTEGEGESATTTYTKTTTVSTYDFTKEGGAGYVDGTPKDDSISKDDYDAATEKTVTSYVTKLNGRAQGSASSTEPSYVQYGTKTVVDGVVTLQNYFKLGEDGVTVNYNNGSDQSKKLADLFETALAYDYSSAKKGQKINGTFLDETIIGSKYADKINTLAGADTVTAGQGNDTISLGAGAKTVNIAGGDGYDTIKGLSNATSLALNISGAVGSNNFVKSGNNLVIEHDIYSYKDGKEVKYSTSASRSVDNTAVESGYYKVNDDNSILYSKTEKTGYTKIDADHKLYSYGSGRNITYYTSATHSENNTLVTEKTTVADYFIGNNADKVSTVALNSLNISGKGKIAGTKYNDVITGSAKADKITTGDGADTITAGKGNDTITIDGTGVKTLNFDRTSGKDTVVVTAGDDFESANLKFDGDATYTYDHSVNGNDLIINANYAKVDKIGTTPAQKASTATITVKDYFADGLGAKVKVNGTEVNTKYATATLNSNTADARLAPTVDTTGNNIYNVTSTTYKYPNEGGKLYSTSIIVDESGNDLYNVASLKSNTYINDKAGRDALNIKVTDPDNVCMIFDVLSAKQSTEPATLYGDNSLFIFDSNNLKFYDEVTSRTANDFYAKGDVVITAAAYSALEDKTGYEAVATTTAVYSYGTGESIKYSLTDKLAAPVGGVEIADFIKVASNGKYSVGSGAIETINVGDETWSGFSSKGLDTLRAAVAGWLSDHEYDSAYEVLNNGTKDDINALLALYADTGVNGYTAKS